MIGVFVAIDNQTAIAAAAQKIKSYRWFVSTMFISWVLFLCFGRFLSEEFTKEGYLLMIVAGFLTWAFVLSKAASVKCPQCGNEFFRCLVIYPKFLDFLNTFVRQVNTFNRECDQCGFRINFF